MSHLNKTQVGGTHYTSKTVQPWEAMQSWMSHEEFTGFLRGNVIKYIARCNDKGGIEDLRKAQHYLDKLIEVTWAGLPEDNPATTPTSVSDDVMQEIAKAVARRCGMDVGVDGNLITTVSGVRNPKPDRCAPFDAVADECLKRGLVFRFAKAVQKGNSVCWQYEVYAKQRQS